MKLKKINKSEPPNQLTTFFDSNPTASWEEFYNTELDYDELKTLIFTDQGQLCAYCEQSLKTEGASKKRIEHYHSKSDKGNPTINWALDWQNVIGVCLGGSYNDSYKDDSDFKKFPPPDNLSCDSYKGHLEIKNKLPSDFLNPLEIIASPTLFDFDKATGKLRANENNCTAYQQEHDAPSLSELVFNTITVFNLNCDRLTDARLQVFRAYQRDIAKARKRKDEQIHSKLVKQWLGEEWRCFFTTRRILLSTHAEKYLEDKEYQG